MANGLAKLDGLLEAASKGTSGIRKMNFIMARAIPFNKPHGIGIKEVSNERVVAKLPYKRKNLNHLKGLHAAALMTVGEYCSGVWLMKRIGSNYRLIMKSIHVEYHKQGRTDAIATYELSESDYKSKIKTKLDSDGVVFHTCLVKIQDANQELLAEAKVEWQIKDWAKVRKS